MNDILIDVRKTWNVPCMTAHGDVASLTLAGCIVPQPGFGNKTIGASDGMCISIPGITSVAFAS